MTVYQILKTTIWSEFISSHHINTSKSNTHLILITFYRQILKNLTGFDLKLVRYMGKRAQGEKPQMNIKQIEIIET